MNMVRDKLKLQAMEAQHQGLTKLAYVIDNSVNSLPETLTDREAMEDSIHQDLWKIAAKLVDFHDIQNVNVDDLNRSLMIWAEKLTDDLENVLGVDENIKSNCEDQLPGEFETNK